MAKRNRNFAPKHTTSTLPETWDEKLIQALRPWGAELGGAVLFIMASLILFGLFGWIDTNFINLLSNVVWIFTGWVAYPLLTIVACIGIALATRQIKLPIPITITPKQWLGTVLLLIMLMPLTHIMLDTSLAGSQLGEGGGRLGFALAQPLVYFFGAIASYLFYGTIAIYGVTLILHYTWHDFLHHMRLFAEWLREWALQISPADTKHTIAAQQKSAPAKQKQRPVIDRKKMEDLRAQMQLNPPVVVAKKEEEKPKKRKHNGKRDPLLPPLSLLPTAKVETMSPEELAEKREILQTTLKDFGITADVLEDSLVGPAITQFAVVPKLVRVSKIAGLSKDLALALQAPRIRIQAPVPGHGYVGIEVPNGRISTVKLGNVIKSPVFQRVKGGTGIALGLDVSGSAVVSDVTKLPHMLVAGQTGSGKSVFVNSVIASLVFNNTPDDVKLIMIDPKKVELIRFNKLPHLIGKVEVEGERAVGVLQWLTGEMDDRYRKLSEIGARNIKGYNEKIQKHKNVKKMPYIVAFIDELADLMVQFGNEVEKYLCRLAQMARAVGIHLVVATQRPSTDVLTGLIKANFPTRVSFAVASGTDSRVILDSVGAEALLGRGDMLFLSADASTPQRIQGCFVSDEEIDAIVNHWQEALPKYKRGGTPWATLIDKQAYVSEADDLLERALELAQKYDSVSSSMLQRRLRIGYPRAAKLMKKLYEMGMVEDPQSGGRTRKSLVDRESDDPLADFLAEHGEDYVDYPDKPDFD